MELRITKCKICDFEFTETKRRLFFGGNNEVLFCPNCDTGITCFPVEQKTERESGNKEVYNLIDRLDSYFGRKIEFNRRYEQSLSMVKLYSPINSVLDIGCNIGYWLYFLKKKGISDLSGVEMNEDCRNAGRDIFNLEIYPEVQDLNRTFDLISFNDVLEHLENPRSFLRQTFSLTHPKTIYYIQLPNHQSNMARWLNTRWPWWSVPDHLWHFNPFSISIFLKNAGLKIIDLKTCDVMYDVIEYIIPQWLRTFIRPLKYIHRTSGYFYRGSHNGSLITVIAQRELSK